MRYSRSRENAYRSSRTVSRTFSTNLRERMCKEGKEREEEFPRRGRSPRLRDNSATTRSTDKFAFVDRRYSASWIVTSAEDSTRSRSACESEARRTEEGEKESQRNNAQNNVESCTRRSWDRSRKLEKTRSRKNQRGKNNARHKMEAEKTTWSTGITKEERRRETSRFSRSHALTDCILTALSMSRCATIYTFNDLTATR